MGKRTRGLDARRTTSRAFAYACCDTAVHVRKGALFSSDFGAGSAYRLTDGEIVEVAFNLHPADRFSYSVTLQRRG